MTVERTAISDHRTSVGNEDTQCDDPDNTEHATCEVGFFVKVLIHTILYLSSNILMVCERPPTSRRAKYTPVGTPRPCWFKPFQVRS